MRNKLILLMVLFLFACAPAAPEVQSSTDLVAFTVSAPESVSAGSKIEVFVQPLNTTEDEQRFEYTVEVPNDFHLASYRHTGGVVVMTENRFTGTTFRWSGSIAPSDILNMSIVLMTDQKMRADIYNLLSVTDNLTGKKSVKEIVIEEQPDGFRIVADYPYVDPQYLMGKQLLVKAIVRDDVVFEDLDSGEKFKLSVFSAPIYKGYEYNSYGLTEKSVETLQVGYRGEVMWDESAKWAVLFDKEKTFDKVYGSSQDLDFQETWYGFVSDVNDYYSETNTDPTYSAQYGLNFSEDFTPSEACWLAESFSVQVKIDSDFSFCQISDAVWYSDVASAILFTKYFGDKIDLNAVYPNPGDNPSVLSVGEMYGGFTFEGCFPVVEGSFAYEGKVYGTTHFVSPDNFINPVGVVYSSDGNTNGVVMPYMAEIAYEQFDASKRKIFSLPPECDFSK